MSAIDDLSDQQIQTIQDSFNELKSDFPDIVADLYPTFLARFPEHASYFEETNFQHQRHGVVELFKTAIPALNQPEKLEDTLDDLARIHQSYDIPRDAYSDMGTVIIDLLARYTENGWNEQLEQSWLTLWTALSDRLAGC